MLCGRVEEERFLAAAELLLKSFPALGSRLDLNSVPALDTTNVSFPVSFASWPGGSAECLLGVQNASRKLPPDCAVCDEIQVHTTRCLVVQLQTISTAVFWTARPYYCFDPSFYPGRPF